MTLEVQVAVDRDTQRRGVTGRANKVCRLGMQPERRAHRRRLFGFGCEVAMPIPSRHSELVSMQGWPSRAESLSRNSRHGDTAKMTPRYQRLFRVGIPSRYDAGRIRPCPPHTTAPWRSPDS